MMEVAAASVPQGAEAANANASPSLATPSVSEGAQGAQDGHDASASAAPQAQSTTAAPVEMGTMAAEASAQPTSSNPQLDEFELEFKKAQDKPEDFAQWMAVEKLVDKLGDIEKTRQVYDGLLAEFPLCYGYWRKYADAEHKHSSPEWATNVFDRGIAAVPYSADLWGFYCTYKQKIGASAEDIRQLFEQGIAYVGTDYLAHGLWDKYVKYEISQGAFANVARLYVRILGSPLKEIDRYFTSLQTFTEERPALDLMTAEESASISASLAQARQAAAAAAIKVAPEPTPAAAVDGDVKMEVEDGAPGGELGGGEEAKPAAAMDSAGPETPEKDSAGAGDISEADVKQHWLLGVQGLYEDTKRELERRKAFEDVIKRPYFHVKPLDQNQLVAWNSYIDYALTKDDAGLIVRLFERCLVACASYPEFWKRYVRYLEKGEAASALGAVQRAQQVHCKRNASMQLFAANFYERTGDIAAAREALSSVLTQLSPGLVEAVVQAAAFERRQGDNAAARTIFDNALAAAEGKEGSADPDGAILALHYAHFLALTCREAAAARAIYERALKRWPAFRFLWEGAISFEEHCLEDGREDRVLELYKRATASATASAGGDSATTASSPLSDEDAKALSERYVDFAAAALPPAAAETVAAEHDARYSRLSELGRSRKRAAEDAAGGDTKRAASDAAMTGEQPAAVQAASGAYPTTSSYQDPAQTSTSAAQTAQAAYYPTASAGAYGYGYYQYPQQYGYSYTGY